MATEQLMTLHGVAWFGFDEASGNVVDKLGNDYTGTVNGTTRVQGWNSEGSAMSFNGVNNYMPSTIKAPIGDKTIRFKVKIKSAPSAIQGCIFEDYSVNTNSAGLYAFINKSDMRLIFQGYYGTNQSIKYTVNSTEGLNLNEWYDILISYKNTLDGYGLVLYINEELIAKSKIAVLEDSSNSSLRGLHFGALNFTNYRYWNNMEIDDFQIYNKALSPSDFTQKRLVVKTKDNKNLVLSPTSNRVKEIPNTAEYMILAQGGVVREIDSAVDSQPIDFTKTTTEYEIVTNNRTPLGKGRIFTIPIGSDFKTAMIEGN
ncbi:LamG-like jellyroll fold domain-containing protein [Lysinibacillus sp. NPDC093692]|uniref:LamG-like jellyroll fold domain-containing protein n=1 Tax=Lysinibacillus sp. NPDC093692 TaxID=3390578 RepID=UPI003D00A95E